MNDKDDFYSKLKIQLEDTTDFPADYLYKFIVPASENQVKEVESIFSNTGAVISTKNSKKGKYVSASIILKLDSSDEIIAYYRKVEKIKGIISL
jgi:putative lipoic acid-binding regulatory protein